MDVSSPNRCQGCGQVPARDVRLAVCPVCLVRRLLDPEPEDAPVAGSVWRDSGDYILGEEITRGGMGRVVLAQDRTLHRTVAMKVMLERERPGPTDRQRFLREARILARLDHPNIVAVHDMGLDERGIPFFTMRRVQGQTLQAVIDALAAGDPAALAAYPLPRLLEVFLAICNAAQYAHSRGVIHRDLKPQNIMVGAFDEVVVLDWGIACVTGEESVHSTPAGRRGDSRMDLMGTLEGETLGTPHYMPPEQATGSTSKADVRSDVFLLGGILHAILTLQPPFRDEDIRWEGGVLRRSPVVRADAPAFQDTAIARRRGSALRTALPSLVPVVLRALSPRPEDRYPSVDDLAAEVRAQRAGHPTGAEQAGVRRRLHLGLWRHRTGAGVAGVALALGCATFLPGLVGKYTRQAVSIEVLRADGTPVPQVGLRLVPGKINTTDEIPADLPATHVATCPTLDFQEPHGDLFRPIWPSSVPRQTAGVFECVLNLDETGDYLLEMESDDGARLWVDDVVRVDLDGMHPAARASGRVRLEGRDQGMGKGVHRVRVAYFQRIGMAVLRVAWSKEDGKAPFPRHLLGPSTVSRGQAGAWTARLWAISENPHVVFTDARGRVSAPDVSRHQQFEVVPSLGGAEFLPAKGTNDGTGRLRFRMLAGDGRP